MTTDPQAGLRRAGFILITIALAATQVKLQIAQWAGFAAIALWVVLRARDGKWRDMPPFMLPLGLYAGWTLLSAALSPQPLESLIDSKQLLLFLLVPATATFARGERASRVIDVIIAVGAASAVIGIAQFSMFGYDTLDNRAVGPLNHWMTFSGVLMLSAGAAIARLLPPGREWIWPAIAVPALVVALFYTQTRNAMLGLLAAVGVLLAERNWKLLLILPVAAVIFFVAAPQSIVSRVESIWDLNDPSNRDRVAMWETGWGMIQDSPVTGVGPNMVPVRYAEFRSARAVNDVNPHLHNVPIQIAAERGLPALALWLWFVVAVGRDLWNQLRRNQARAVAGAGVAAVVAMLVAGLFEYNFGDSEFLMLFLGLITLPWAATRSQS
ncbi:MAG: O-antigen ligase family protein [Vicinamibacterales bacterium]